MDNRIKCGKCESTFATEKTLQAHRVKKHILTAVEMPS